MRRLIHALAALILACCACAADFQITGSSSGSIAQLTVNAQVQVAPADTGTQGAVYVAAKLFGIWAFEKSDTSWAVWDGTSPPATYFQGTLGAHHIAVVNGLDLRAFPDVQFYVGYGRDFDDMVLGGKYASIATAPAGDLVGTWVIAPGGDAGDTFQFGNGLAIAGDGSFAYYAGCYVQGSYTIGGDTVTLAVQSSAPNPDPDHCTDGPAPGASLALQYVASGDALATYVNGQRGVWQRVPPPTGIPLGTWTTVSVSGTGDFGAGETLTLNADGSFTHIDSPDDVNGCTMTGRYSIAGNIISALATYQGPSPMGACTSRTPSGQSIRLIFSYDGSDLTLWHRRASATWQRTGS